MKPESYYYKALGGRTVRIGLNEVGRWAIWLDDRLVCDDFGDAVEAAFRAHRKNFSDEWANELFRGIYVPEHLDSWRRFSPDDPLFNSPESPHKPHQPPGDCKTRCWKPGGGGRPEF